MVVVGGGWVVLSLHSPLLHGCCGRGLGCIKSSVTLPYGCCGRGLGCIKSSLASAAWLLWEVVGLY